MAHIQTFFTIQRENTLTFTRASHTCNSILTLPIDRNERNPQKSKHWWHKHEEWLIINLSHGYKFSHCGKMCTIRSFFDYKIIIYRSVFFIWRCMLKKHVKSTQISWFNRIIFRFFLIFVQQIGKGKKIQLWFFVVI